MGDNFTDTLTRCKWMRKTYTALKTAITFDRWHKRREKKTMAKSFFKPEKYAIDKRIWSVAQQ